jgi:hypothetical protein
MPLQNRVDPFGNLFRTPARGTMMGNRGGVLHANREIIRPHKSRRWIMCVLEFKDRHRIVMSERRYTELFFLDEATALAAARPVSRGTQAVPRVQAGEVQRPSDRNGPHAAARRRVICCDWVRLRRATHRSPPHNNAGTSVDGSAATVSVCTVTLQDVMLGTNSSMPPLNGG